MVEKCLLMLSRGPFAEARILEVFNIEVLNKPSNQPRITFLEDCLVCSKILRVVSRAPVLRFCYTLGSPSQILLNYPDFSMSNFE